MRMDLLIPEVRFSFAEMHELPFAGIERVRVLGIDTGN